MDALIIIIALVACFGAGLLIWEAIISYRCATGKHKVFPYWTYNGEAPVFYGECEHCHSVVIEEYLDD